MASNYRISGHETFSCRYAWLPKAVRGVARDRGLFDDEERAMVDLGLGRNMVRAVRFWAQAAGMLTPAGKGGGHALTKLGSTLLGERGLDPFLEDIRTLWLIHWNLSTDVKQPLLAWDFLLNRWQEPEIARSAVLRALQQEAARQDDDPSPVTLEHHFDTFLHTYVPTRGRKGEVHEDNLDCPLVELDLIGKVGERLTDSAGGRAEPIYAFRREEKPDITADLFVYCLNDFWEKRHAAEATLHFREVAHGHGSPGQIFKLPEEDVRARVEGLERQTKGFFAYAESLNLQQIRRHGQRDGIDWLKAVYRMEQANG
ncbi:MAG: DUF4007 family protein [Verrucomicrobia bacterium]|nr:DUF4007 family protein [Verrucomicrobiota bacterium]